MLFILHLPACIIRVARATKSLCCYGVTVRAHGMQRHAAAKLAVHVRTRVPVGRRR